MTENLADRFTPAERERWEQLAQRREVLERYVEERDQVIKEQMRMVDRAMHAGEWRKREEAAHGGD